MEQGRTEEDMKQQQDHHNQRLKTPVQSDNQPHLQQPQQPQKCPRCDSLNTKFCYYNNYSLSQPRYFCKTCRRYWTQGGTLRNVPVGGGCRKGKRTKASSSGGENSRSQPSSTAAPPHDQLLVPQSLATPGTMLAPNSGTPPSLALRNKELGHLAIPPMSSYYSGGGFLSSLAAMQSLSQPQPFNQPLNVGGQFGGSSNLALLQGFNVPTFSSQQAQNQQIQQQNEFYLMGNRDKNIESLYPSDQSLIHPNRPIGSWNQSLINSSTTNPTASHPSFWNSSTSNASNSSTTGTSLNPNQWPDLQGYGPPP